MATEALSEAIQEGIDIAAYVEFAGASGFIALQAATFRSTRIVNAGNNFSHDHIEQVKGFANTTAEYVHSQSIGAIALLDGAARPFYKPLIESWREHYDHKTDPHPPIFFLNPQGFQERLNPGIRSFVGPIIKPLIKGGPVGMPWQRRSRQAITEGFVQEHPWLYQHREEPLLVIDGCLHSGSSAAPVLSGLKRIGFTDVRLAVASSSRKRALHVECKPDIVLSKKTPLGGCYPFGIDKMTEKTHGASISQVTGSQKRRDMAIHLRRNLNTYFGSAVEPATD